MMLRLRRRGETLQWPSISFQPWMISCGAALLAPKPSGDVWRVAGNGHSARNADRSRLREGAVGDEVAVAAALGYLQAIDAGLMFLAMLTCFGPQRPQLGHLSSPWSLLADAARCR